MKHQFSAEPLTCCKVGIETGGPSGLVLEPHVAGQGLRIVQLEKVNPTCVYTNITYIVLLYTYKI